MLRSFFTPKRIYLLLSLFILVNLAFKFGPWSISALEEVSGGASIPDLMPGYDLAQLKALFAAYGPEGIAIYKKIQILDFIYPLIYGALMLGLMVRIRIPRQFRSIAYMNPVLAVIFDYAENLMLRKLVNHYPFLTPDFRKTAEISSLLTNAKWTLIAISIITIVVFGIRYILQEKKRHSSRGHHRG